MQPFNWTCPFCGKPQTVVEDNAARDGCYLHPITSKYGRMYFVVESVACANPECKEITLKAFLHRLNPDGKFAGRPLFDWQLRPQSEERPQPQYIPDPIRQDYYEACRIRDLSPKASATIARRCLQGMIRDFCGIVKPTLLQEISELKQRVEAGAAPRGVSHDTMDAIDHVRSLGNIGAHMEKDINQIVDIDAGEAQTLINLIETLFADWYVAREQRAERLRQLRGVAADKQAQRKALPRPERAASAIETE